MNKMLSENFKKSGMVFVFGILLFNIIVRLYIFAIYYFGVPYPNMPVFYKGIQAVNVHFWLLLIDLAMIAIGYYVFKRTREEKPINHDLWIKVCWAIFWVLMVVFFFYGFNFLTFHWVFISNIVSFIKSLKNEQNQPMA